MDAKNSHPWLMLSIIMCLYLKLHLCSGAAIITANQSLMGNQTIVSARNAFTLGFFKPGNSSKYYIGIWYTGVTTQTVVWVANRDKGVSNFLASELRISNGNLVLLNESKEQIWTTDLNFTSSSSAMEAELLDTGNLVLRESSSNSSDYLWQSLDHPTDTWLPGGKIGLNKKTKKNTRLISWKNKEDPAQGLFSLELDPNGTSQYYILWNMTQNFWTSGTWNGQIFSLVPEMRLNYIYNFSYIDNENESYFTYSVYDTSIISRFVMHVGGQIQQMSWLTPSNQWSLFWSQPRVQCEVYAYCGAYGSCSVASQPFCQCLKGFTPNSQSDWNSEVYSEGCVRTTDLQCDNSTLINGKPNRFYAHPNMNVPKNGQLETAGSADECESICLRNCSCTAYAYDNNQCSLWHGDLLNLQQLTEGDTNARTIYVKLAASEFSSSKNNKWVVIGVVVGSVVAVLLLGLVLFVILRRRTSKTGKRVEGSLVAFGYRDLQNATRNFSEKLGGGGFGSVFKGVLPDSSVVAVKKLESITQGEKQFRTEVSTIGTIQHVNLVRLRGFCSEGIRKLLVYDYMPNGSLDSQLFHQKDDKVLDWKIRRNIALGTARGLMYLHEKCRDCIIHCDIKPENILLDADLCPKVADFGLAKLIGREFSRVLTTMRGTRGYLAPEWISGVAITAKADVYSYGMMLFEFVSGRRNTEQSEDGKVNFFPTWAVKVVTEGGDVLSLLDPRLEEDVDIEELIRILKVACWCIQDEEAQRPSMGQVIQILEGVLDVPPLPMPRTLQVFEDNQEHIIFFTESSARSSEARSNKSTASSQSKSIASSLSAKSIKEEQTDNQS